MPPMFIPVPPLAVLVMRPVFTSPLLMTASSFVSPPMVVDLSLIHILSGYTPEVSVDAEGFWTVNGERLNDAEGDPIEANDGESCLFKDIARDANGNLSLTLGDGKIITLPIQQVLNLTLSTAINTTVVDPTVPATDVYKRQLRERWCCSTTSI